MLDAHKSQKSSITTELVYLLDKVDTDTLLEILRALRRELPDRKGIKDLRGGGKVNGTVYWKQFLIRNLLIFIVRVITFSVKYIYLRKADFLHLL
jgi:hypothetical protein